MRYTHSSTLFLIETQLLSIRPVTKTIKVRSEHLYSRSQITKFSIDLCVICIQFNIGRNTVSNIKMYDTNYTGPRMVPYGAPETTGAQSEKVPLTTTRCSWQVRKCLSQLNKFPSRPRLRNLISRRPWGTCTFPCSSFSCHCCCFSCSSPRICLLLPWPLCPLLPRLLPPRSSSSSSFVFFLLVLFVFFLLVFFVFFHIFDLFFLVLLFFFFLVLLFFFFLQFVIVLLLVFFFLLVLFFLVFFVIFFFLILFVLLGESRRYFCHGHFPCDLVIATFSRR